MTQWLKILQTKGILAFSSQWYTSSCMTLVNGAAPIKKSILTSFWHQNTTQVNEVHVPCSELYDLTSYAISPTLSFGTYQTFYQYSAKLLIKANI